jgi:hypothetical protein
MSNLTNDNTGETYDIPFDPLYEQLGLDNRKYYDNIHLLQTKFGKLVGRWRTKS